MNCKTTNSNKQSTNKKKSAVDGILTKLDALSLTPTRTEDIYRVIVESGFPSDIRVLAAIICPELIEINSNTLRGLLYRVESTGRHSERAR